MQYIKDLSESGLADIAVAGGKGASLGELLRIDAPVPLDRNQLEDY